MGVPQLLQLLNMSLSFSIKLTLELEEGVLGDEGAAEHEIRRQRHLRGLRYLAPCVRDGPSYFCKLSSRQPGGALLLLIKDDGLREIEGIVPTCLHHPNKLYFATSPNLLPSFPPFPSRTGLLSYSDLHKCYSLPIEYIVS